MKGFRIWLRAVRPFAYPASAIPAATGIAVAWSEGYSFKHILAILTLLGVMSAHTGANLMSDYFDFKRGIDRAGTCGGSGVLVEGLLSPKSVLIASLGFFAISGIVAHALIIGVGYQIIWPVILGLVAGVFYSFPPFGFKYGALGELVVFLAFGIGITVGAYAVQSGHYSWTPFLYALPFGFLVSAILYANNMRDSESDVAVGVVTLAASIGLNRSRFVFGAMIFLSYFLLVLFVAQGSIVPGALAALITTPLALRLVSKVYRIQCASDDVLKAADAETAKLSLAFGIAMILGVVMWTVSTS